jgi:MFS superfamily sulfate permease-like transporter
VISKAILQIPEVLILMVCMLIISGVVRFGSRYGTRTLGNFDNDLIPPFAPVFDSAQFSRLLVPAVIISLAGFIESQSVSKTFGYKEGYFPDVNRELIAFGTACGLSNFNPIGESYRVVSRSLHCFWISSSISNLI